MDSGQLPTPAGVLPQVRCWRQPGLQSQRDQGRILVVPLTCCVTLIKWLNLSGAPLSSSLS